MTRSFTFAAALLALGATACHKATVSPSDAGLVGEWRWVASTGGIAGATYTPASTSTTQQWVFRADSTYERYTTRQGTAQLTEAGTFSLGTAASIYTGQPARTLRLRSQRSQTYIVQELSTGHLSLADNYYDGFTSTYER